MLKSSTVGLPGDARLAFAVQSIVWVCDVESPDCLHPLHVKLALKSGHLNAVTQKPGPSENIIFSLKSCPSMTFAGSDENVTVSAIVAGRSPAHAHDAARNELHVGGISLSVLEGNNINLPWLRGCACRAEPESSGDDRL